jgi:phosphoglycolate phosphatase-like HAD superfamily hydrolase
MELGYSEEVAAEAQRLWVERIELREWLSLDAVLPGVAEAVEAMRSDGVSLFVLTARRDPSAAAWQVEQLELGLDDVDVVDPYHAAERKAEVLRTRGAAGMIGDTDSDAAAAAGASIPFVAVSTGQRSEAFLRGAGVNPVVADLGTAWAELRRLLGA